jgi:HD-GYP domain-containing protein (c-di-GMP phosphodiesterase class II)
VANKTQTLIYLKMAANSQTTSRQRVLDRPLDKGLLSVKFDPSDYDMASLNADLMMPGEPSPGDLYLAVFNPDKKKVEMRLACAKGELFQGIWQERLRKAEQGRLYVKYDQAEEFSDYYTRFGGAILHSAPSLRKKRQVIQDMALVNLRLFFEPQMEGKKLSLAANRASALMDQAIKEPALLENLGAVMRQDYSIYAHSVNVSMLAMSFGHFLGLDAKKIRTLGMGGLFHDVGMSSLPASILKKTEKLSEPDWQKIRTHPRKGYQMLLNVGAVTYDALMIVLNHHENIDGTGYPSGLKGEKITQLTRIVKIVDAYDAITSARPYHPPRPAFAAANDLMESRSDQFDKDLVPYFIRFLASPYVGGAKE